MIKVLPVFSRNRKHRTRSALDSERPRTGEGWDVFIVVMYTTPWWTEIVKNLQRKAKLQFCLHGNIPTLPTVFMESGLVSHHTAGCTGGSYLIPVRRSCIPTLGCCKSLLSSLHCSETVDLNHKVAKAVSLMYEHVFSVLLKVPECFIST